MRKQAAEGGGGGHDGGGELRWLLTYADMITLLMAFFIMLYSMSILNLSKFREVAVSIRSGFGGVLEGQGSDLLYSTGQLSIRPSPIPGDTAGVPMSVVNRLEESIQKQKLSSSVRIYSDHRGLVISILSDKVVFDPGKSAIRPEALSALGSIAELLRDIPNEVRVEGHTCDLPVASGPFQTNWELSTGRATTVVRYFIESQRVPPERLSAGGYADTHPIVPNTSEPNRQQNRRVEIVIVRQQMLPEARASEPAEITASSDQP